MRSSIEQIEVTPAIQFTPNPEEGSHRPLRTPVQLVEIRGLVFSHGCPTTPTTCPGRDGSFCLYPHSRHEDSARTAQAGRVRCKGDLFPDEEIEIERVLANQDPPEDKKPQVSRSHVSARNKKERKK